jgi:hypothetical protein
MIKVVSVLGSVGRGSHRPAFGWEPNVAEIEIQYRIETVCSIACLGFALPPRCRLVMQARTLLRISMMHCLQIKDATTRTISLMSALKRADNAPHCPEGLKGAGMRLALGTGRIR